MCNQILFTTSLCGHTLPPILDTTCPLAFSSSTSKSDSPSTHSSSPSTCPRLTTTHEHLPNALCPSCHPTGTLPYSFYKHEFYSILCGHSFGHADSDLLRLSGEPDVVLVTPTEEETCGEEVCRHLEKGRNWTVRGKKEEEIVIGKSKMPSEYEGLRRVFTKMPDLESMYLEEDGRPKTELVKDRVPKSVKQRPTLSYKTSSSCTKDDSNTFRDTSKYDSQTMHPDDEAMNFPTAHFNSGAAQPLTVEEEEERINNFPSKWADPKYFPPSPERRKDTPKSSSARQRSSNTVGGTTNRQASSACSTSRYSTAQARISDMSRLETNSRADASRRPSSSQAPVGRNEDSHRTSTQRRAHDSQSHSHSATPSESHTPTTESHSPTREPLVLRRSSRPSQHEPVHSHRSSRGSTARGQD
ncbi:hypothetical protein DL98DRAFT_657889 [Cadophora sp. DSE1049]|nr:hypothetical protein DL98DRAFT_657889 [Cadophora sp. DSE1049]